MSRKELESLDNDPDVIGLSLDAEVRSAATTVQGGTTGVDVQRLRAIVGAPRGLTGKNVGVVVIDSGIARYA